MCSVGLRSSLKWCWMQWLFMFFAYLFFSVLVKVRNNAMILPTWTWRSLLQLLKANETRKTLIIWNHWRTTKIKCERVNCLFPTNFSVHNTIISVFTLERDCFRSGSFAEVIFTVFQITHLWLSSVDETIVSFDVMMSSLISRESKICMRFIFKSLLSDPHSNAKLPCYAVKIFVYMKNSAKKNI